MFCDSWLIHPTVINHGDSITFTVSTSPITSHKVQIVLFHVPGAPVDTGCGHRMGEGVTGFSHHTLPRYIREPGRW